MPSCEYLVVVLPGIGGSVLADESGREVWRADAATVAGRVLDPGALDISENLHPTRLISSYAVGPWQLITGYDGLMRRLTTALRLSQANVATSGRGLVKPDASLVAFPYDFRRSVEHNAVALDTEIRCRAQGRPVVLVAHSMGGLVASCWWANLSEGIEVKEIITLGTPFRGATKALEWLVNGVRVGPMTFTTATRVLRGWRSVFDLLPHWQVATGPDGENLYPHEIATFASVREEFAVRARQAYEANCALRDAMEVKAASAGLPLTVYYSQGHGTLSSAGVAGGVVTTARKDPAWLPPEWGQGDGTVPMFSAIPQLLERQPTRWHRLRQKHGELVEDEAVAGHVAGYGLAPLPPAARGGDAGAGDTYVCVDLDEVVPAGESQTVRITLDGPEPTARSVQMTIATCGAVRAEPDGDSWVLELPPLEEGAHEYRVVAEGVPDVDRVVLDSRVGAVTCESE